MQPKPARHQQNLFDLIRLDRARSVTPLPEHSPRLIQQCLFFRGRAWRVRLQLDATALDQIRAIIAGVTGYGVEEGERLDGIAQRNELRTRIAQPQRTVAQLSGVLELHARSG